MKLQQVAVIAVALICGSVAHADPRSEPVRVATVDQAPLMYRLGVMYDEGLGVQSDYAAAYRLVVNRMILSYYLRRHN